MSFLLGDGIIGLGHFLVCVPNVYCLCVLRLLCLTGLVCMSIMSIMSIVQEQGLGFQTRKLMSIYDYRL